MTEPQLHRLIRNSNGKISPKLRLQILKRDNYTCRSCHRQLSPIELQVDHIILRSKGGQPSLQNLRTLCKTCHTINHSVDMSTFYMLGSVMDEVLGPNQRNDTFKNMRNI